MAQFVNNPVLNSITGASDVSLSAGVLSVSNVAATGDAFKPMAYGNISSANGGVKKYLLENANVVTLTYTAAASTTYSFTISQYVDGNQISKTIEYTSDATGADATIATALVTAINANTQLQVTASGAASPLTITADAGYPLFTVTNGSNVTSSSGMATYAPNATAASAITNVIAPDSTAATAIAGTATVTVTTAAAHGLVAGDIVTIASVATMTLAYTNSSGQALTAQTGGQFRVATVPTSTTFTLEGVRGAGTNSGTITITADSCAFVQTAAAQASIEVGDQLAIAGVATATLNGGASGTSRVGAVLASAQRFKLEGAVLVGTNSGTITITAVASESRGSGSVLDAEGISGVSTSNLYASVTFSYIDSNIQPDFQVLGRGLSKEQTLYINESDTDAPAFLYALDKALNGVVLNTPLVANPEAYSKL